MRFTRLDTGAAVDAAVDLSMAPASDALEILLARLSKGLLDEPGEIDMGREWQERVRHLLLDLAHDPGVFVVRRAERAGLHSTMFA